jgi:hypothetical protein
MKKLYLFSIFFVSLATLVKSQGVGDAVRFSQFNPGGTARVLGVGGAFGAMGGDFSVLNINPAGLGEFKMSEFTITPSFNQTSARAGYANLPGNTNLQKRSQLSLDNAGLVFSSKNPGRFATSNFAVGFSKIADLSDRFTYGGKSQGSITQRFIERANSKTPSQLDNFEAGIAFDAGAIYDLNGDLDYEADVFPDELLTKSQEVIRDGQINELTFAWAGKIDNKLNVGFSLNVPIINFEEQKYYKEEDIGDEVPFFEQLLYDEFLTVSGTGFNVKGGFIYSANNFIRLGGSFHSPTWYTLNDNFSSTIDYTYFDNGRENFNASSPQGDFKYLLNTPWRLIGSIGSIYNLGKIKGFINADVEYTDYKNNQFNFTKFSDAQGDRDFQNEVNRDIDNLLSQAINFRLGTELAISKLRLRAGLAATQTPFSADIDRNITSTFGIGLRENKYFIDVALVNNTVNSGFIPYALLDSTQDPLVNVETARTRVVMTFGFKF